MFSLGLSVLVLSSAVAVGGASVILFGLLVLSVLQLFSVLCWCCRCCASIAAVVFLFGL